MGTVIALSLAKEREKERHLLDGESVYDGSGELLGWTGKVMTATKVTSTEDGITGRCVCSVCGTRVHRIDSYCRKCGARFEVLDDKTTQRRNGGRA